MKGYLARLVARAYSVAAPVPLNAPAGDPFEERTLPPSVVTSARASGEPIIQPAPGGLVSPPGESPVVKVDPSPAPMDPVPSRPAGAKPSSGAPTIKQKAGPFQKPPLLGPPETNAKALQLMAPPVKERQAIGAAHHEPATSGGEVLPQEPRPAKLMTAVVPTAAQTSADEADAAGLLRRADHFMARVIHHLPPDTAETDMVPETVSASKRAEVAVELSPQQRGNTPHSGPADPGPAVVIGQLSVEVISSPPPAPPGPALPRITFRGRTAGHAYTRRNSSACFGLGQF